MKKQNLFNLTLTALFIAIIVIMDFTPLGYITTGAFSITLMTLPVAVGAVCLGVKGGIILGAMFGLTSFLQCFGIGFMIDPSASLLFNTSPIATAVTCFIPRILAGLITALVFELLSKNKKQSLISISVSCSLMPILNTILFLSCYVLLFKNTILSGVAVKTVFLSAISLNGLIELLVTLAVGSVLCKVVFNFVNKLKVN